MKPARPEFAEALAEAIRAVSAGGGVLLHDAARPEAGGYLCASARRITPETINRMASRAGGLICLAMPEDHMRRLGIPLLVADTPFRQGHAFGASIEASRGVTTGISAGDRAETILLASDPGATPADIVMPGHVFPIQVRAGGVLLRPDMPSAASDLCTLAGETACAVVCAVLDETGEIAGPEALAGLSRELGFPLLPVGALVAHRLANESVVERTAERDLDSGLGGHFRAIVYRNEFDRDEHMALVAGDVSGEEPVTVRVHSQCLTGDVFGSTRCDCGEQLRLATELIAHEGRGVVVYMHQEGRGIGLSPDGNTLYWAETHNGRVFRRTIVEPGVLAPTMPLDTTVCLAGLPGYQLLDSLAVDGEGNVCVATLINGGITLVNPVDGSLSHVPTDDLLTTNICFGDNDGSGEYRDAYITCSGTGRLLHMRWPHRGLRLNHL